MAGKPNNKTPDQKTPQNRYTVYFNKAAVPDEASVKSVHDILNGSKGVTILDQGNATFMVEIPDSDAVTQLCTALPEDWAVEPVRYIPLPRRNHNLR